VLIRAAVEANIIDKLYTLAIDEMFSASLQMQTIRFHANASSVYQVVNLRNNTMYTVMANSSAASPVGVCSMMACGNSSCPGQMRGLNNMLATPVSETYLGPGFKVRYMDCHRWGRAFSTASGDNYTAYYHFQQGNWTMKKETFVSLPKRILVNGSVAGRAFSHSYEIVDMVPQVSNADVFDPCKVIFMGALGLPSGTPMVGCGCEATAPATPAVLPTTEMTMSKQNAALIGLLVPLLTLGLGVIAGKYFERRDTAGLESMRARRGGEAAASGARGRAWGAGRGGAAGGRAPASHVAMAWGRSTNWGAREHS